VVASVIFTPVYDKWLKSPNSFYTAKIGAGSLWNAFSIYSSIRNWIGLLACLLFLSLSLSLLSCNKEFLPHALNKENAELVRHFEKKLRKVEIRISTLWTRPLSPFFATFQFPRWNQCKEYQEMGKLWETGKNKLLSGKFWAQNIFWICAVNPMWSLSS
jgi:hypothetical protein